MTRTTILLPKTVKARVKREAHLAGVSLGEYLRTLVEARLPRPKKRKPGPDPFFDDPFVIEGGPTDVVENLDKYLDKSLLEEHERQIRDWKSSKK